MHTKSLIQNLQAQLKLMLYNNEQYGVNKYSAVFYNTHYTVTLYRGTKYTYTV